MPEQITSATHSKHGMEFIDIDDETAERYRHSVLADFTANPRAFGRPELFECFDPDAQDLDSFDDEERAMDAYAAVRFRLYDALTSHPDDVDLKRVPDLLGLSGMPEELLRTVSGSTDKATHTNKALFDRLAALGADRKYAVNNVTYLQVMLWYNRQLVEKQKLFEQHEIEGMVASTEEALKTATERGDLPASGLAKFRERIPKTNIILSDPVEVAFNHSAGSTIVYADGTYTVIVAGTRQDDFDHEAMHVVAGYADNEPNRQGIATTCGLRRIFGNSLISKDLDEAIAEHASDAMRHSKPERTKVRGLFRRKTEVYEDNRGLLHRLCKSGRRRIDPRLFIEAAWEEAAEEEQHGEQSATARLRAALETAHPGMDIVEKMSDEYMSKEELGKEIRNRSFGRLGISRLVSLKHKPLR